MKIGGLDPLDIAKNVGGNIAQDAMRRADPLNLFGGDSLTKGGTGRANGVGGTGGIEDILAALGSKKDKNNNFDAGDAGNSLFKAGTDSGGGAGGGIGDALGKIGGVVNQVMGMLKQIMPIIGMIAGFL